MMPTLPLTPGEAIQIFLICCTLSFAAGAIVCALLRGWWAERGCGK